MGATATEEPLLSATEQAQTVSSLEQSWRQQSAQEEEQIALAVAADALEDAELRGQLKGDDLDPDAVRASLTATQLMRSAQAEREAFREARLGLLEASQRSDLAHGTRRVARWRLVAATGLVAAAVAVVVAAHLDPRRVFERLIGLFVFLTAASQVVLWWMAELDAFRALVARRAASRRLAEAGDVYRRALADKGVPEEVRALRNRARMWAPEARQGFNERGEIPQVDVLSNDERDLRGNAPVANAERPVLHELSAYGLAEVSTHDWEMSTAALARVRDLMRTMPGGTIGVAGPRGAGKTTLLRALYRENEGFTDDARSRPGRVDGISIMVAAPVAYEPREFVTMLFVGACNKVLHRRESGPRVGRDAASTRSRRGLLLRGLRAYLSVQATGVVLIVAGLLLLRRLAVPPARDIEGWALLIVGYLVVMAGILRQWRWIRARGRTAPDPEKELRDSAAVHLNDLQFEHTETRGTKGKWDLPRVGLGLELTATDEIARRELSYAEIVSGLRAFLDQCARARIEIATVTQPLRGDEDPATQGVQPRLIVAIDELDKLASIETAREFMNELKALFGIQDCFFLISISEDAMASFETRGLPFRDVFDSSLDEVVTVSSLTLLESRELLIRRVDGLELPFIALLHCVAGGVARDVIRHARGLVLLSQRPHGQIGLGEVCSHIVREELRSKGSAIIAAVRATPFTRPPSQLLAFAERLRSAEPTHDELTQLRGAAQNPQLSAGLHPNEEAATVRLSRIAGELDGFLYFLIALLELFDDELSEQRLLEDERSEDPRARIGHLAHARQAFGAGSGLAVAMIDEWREARGAIPTADGGFSDLGEHESARSAGESGHPAS
jgi:hypothetical protein